MALSRSAGQAWAATITKASTVLYADRANAYGFPGRAVVIDPEPLLEAWMLSNLQPMLTLYCQPAPGYTFEWKTNLLDADWVEGGSFELTNLWETFEIPATAPAQFFRARRP